MAHVADHQLVALFELAALDGAGEQVAGGGEEGGLLRAERPLFRGADAEDAIGAAVAAGDGHVHAAHAGVVLHILGTSNLRSPAKSPMTTGTELSKVKRA